MQKKTGKTEHITRQNIVWAAVSLVLALAVWAYYGNNFGTEITRTFYGVEVTYNGEAALRESLSLVVSQEEATSVNVTLTGSRRDIGKLSSSDLKAVVNLSNVTRAGYRSMAYTLSYPSSVNTNSVSVKSQAPQTVGLQISKLSTRAIEFKGRFDGTSAAGYAVDASAMTFDPSYITVIGPEEELEAISCARVVVDRDNVSTSFSAAANYHFTDADGNILEYDDLQTDADSVIVTVPVSMTKDVKLDVTLVEGGGAIADNIIKDIQPSTVTIAGDAATIEGINTISLATIDLSDFSSFPAAEYPIVLPNGTESLTGETTATVSLSFTGLATRLFTVTNLDYINLAEGYEASIMPVNMIISVRAPESVIGDIEANNIRAVADLTDITTTSKAPVTVYVDGYEQAGAVGDYTMYVDVHEED